MCTMAINSQFNGIELTFAGKPADEVRAAMKEAGFRWHHQKKLWYAKRTAERLALAEKLSGTENVGEAPAAAPAPAQVEVVSKFGIKAGDILEDSWGYEQTNVEFYLVTKILSPCRVEIVELGHRQVTVESSMSETVVPDLERRIGEPLKKTVAQGTLERAKGKWHIKINDSVSLTPWDGQPCFQSSWY